MKYGSVCSGIEAASVAWESLGWQAQWYSEIEHFPSAVLAHRFPTVPNLGDMTLIHETQQFQDANIDLLVGGTPCFALGTPIVTSRGIIPIEDVVVGDMVLTHKLRWKPVLAIGSKEAETVMLGGHGNGGIETTSEHPFYSKIKNQIWNNSKRMYERNLSQDAEWIEAKDMVGRFWGIPTSGELLPIPPITLSGNETHLPIMNQSFYWVVGAWLGDGWTRISERRSYVLICADKNNHKSIAQHLDGCNLKYSISEERTTIRYQIASSALAKWLVANFNKGAKNKTLASWVLFGLNQESKKSLFDGYCFADGYKIYNSKQNQNGFGATTISQCLATGIKLLAASLGYSVGENYCKPKRRVTTIEGRRVNEQPFYQIRFHSHSRSAVQENGILWQKTKTYKQTNAIRTVSNIEVADDNSYVAGGIIVHNCQSFSVAGLRKGLDDPRGQLMYTFVELAARKRPRWVVWENVPGVLSSNKGGDFASFLGLLTGRDIQAPVGGWSNSGCIEGISSAYGVAWTMLDAQDFGVAQRRKRIFVIGYLGDWRPPAAVLFERNRLQGDTTKSREKRKATSADAKGGVGGGSQPIAMAHGQANAEVTINDKSPTLSCVHESPIVAHAFKVRGGSETETGEQGGTPGKKAGKGYLGQDEKAFTIGTTQDQQIAQPIVYENHPADSRVKEMGETCQTVSARFGTGGGNVPLVQQPIAVDCYNQTINHKTSQTIGSSASDVNHYGAVLQPIAFQLSGDRDNPSVSVNDKAFCIPASPMSDRGQAVMQPVPYRKTKRAQSKDDHETWVEDDKANTINTFDVGDVRTTQAIVQPIAFDTFNQTTSNVNQTIKSPQGGLNESIGVIAQPMAVDFRNQNISEDVTGTIQSKSNGGYSLNYQPEILQPTMASLVAKGPHGVATQNIAPVYNVTMEVQKRKYEVDVEGLKVCLKTHKNLTNNEISEILNVPKTKVEHWFRSDKSFAIPDPECWIQLKELLKIETDVFDKSITEFIVDENKYDSGNRIYDTNFPSPTLTSASSGNDNYLHTMAIRRLTPKECERLQGFPDVTKIVKFTLWYDHQNNCVNVAIKCHKRLNNASLVERKRTLEFAESAQNNLLKERASQESVVGISVRINSGQKQIDISNVEKSLSNALTAEQKNKFLLLMQQESFVHQLVHIMQIEEAIIRNGKEELHLNTMHFTPEKNGSLCAGLFGQEKEGFAKDVEIMMDENIRYIISSCAQSSQNLDMSNQTWLCFVLSVIAMFTQGKTFPNNSFDFEISTTSDWTLIPYRNKPADQCPDGPRYKACGNSMAVPCMAWLGQRIQMVDDILNEQYNGAAAIPQL